MADQLISTFKAGEFSKVSGEVDFFDYLDHVQMGRWQDVVLSVRAKKTDKKKVPSVTVSGTFEDRRRVDNFRTHSGVIGIDLDIQDNPDLNDKKDALAADPYCLALHHSVGGFGLVWYVKVNPEKHLDAFQAIEKYLSNTYGVIVDPSGKDVSRLRYVSFDPDMYINKKSKKWTKYLAKKEREIQNTYRINAFHTEDIQFIMEQISGRSINICEDYHSWLHCSFALADEFGEGGRQYFHAISAQSNKYNSKKCDWQYDVALKRQGSGISIGTFFHYCKEAGVDIQTEAT